MSIFRIGVRAGAAAVALGLSLAGPHAAGTAAADTGDSGSDSESRAASAPRSAGSKGSPAHSAQGARPGDAGAHRSGAGSRHSTAAQAKPRTTNDFGSRPALRLSDADAPSTAVPDPAEADSAPITSNAPAAVAAPAELAATASAQGVSTPIQQLFDSASNRLSTLPANPVSNFLEGGLLLVRRTLFPSTSSDSDADPLPTTASATPPTVTPPTITMYNNSQTQTMWVYNLTNSGQYNIPNGFLPVSIAPGANVPITLALNNGGASAAGNRIYVVQGSPFALPITDTSGVDPFYPASGAAGDSFMPYTFIEYNLYSVSPDVYNYTIDISYIDEWSLPVQFKFDTTDSGWNGAANGTTYGFKNYSTVTNQLTAAGAPYSDLEWSGSTPYPPQPPTSIPRIIGPDKVWAQQFNEPTSNYYMNTTGWVPTSYQDFVASPIAKMTNPYSFDGTLYAQTYLKQKTTQTNFDFWRYQVTAPISTPYPTALRTAAMMDGHPADANGVYGFFTFPNDEAAGQFTNAPTSVSLDIYVNDTIDDAPPTEGVIAGGTWMYSAPAKGTRFVTPRNRATLSGTNATDTFILNHQYQRLNAPFIQASQDESDLVVIDSAQWAGATSHVVDFVDKAKFCGPASHSSQFVFERSTGNLYYDRFPNFPGYTSVLANLSQSNIIPEQTIYVL